ncbi:squalene synthase HpnC [Prauserella muralis]|uniref:Squalene synthase HpnC n=1 Tax=Prauserella muralis TaxID=588067 RepID=A0A2V4AQH2_9PSEU|nr:squalene synthase HpnC [Prauserella muralis]PXY22274.1 squalene synthase HpnC [Prauserella muralis]TWE27917.1 squalene synthase HpnC [Prauserella muralis]
MRPAEQPIRDGTVPGSGERAERPPPLQRVLATARGENFPVAMRLLPAAHRRHLLALYSFARMVDDIGDEAPGDRIRLLDTVSAELDRLYAGTVPPGPLYRELAATIAACGLPREPFERLIDANRQDQAVRRYRTFDDLLAYCTLSADPVGRLVLGVFGADTPERRVLSDRICSALQVLEHCQDVVEDARAGRIYLPLDDLDRFGVGEDDLLAPRASRAVRALVGYEVQRAVQLLDEGTPLVGTLTGVARVAVAGYVAGGRATAVALADARFDVLVATPRPSRARTVAEWASLLVAGGAR